MDGRFAGQEGSLVMLNATTNEPLVPDVNIVGWTFEPMFELTEHEFIGELSPTFREFCKGYSLALDLQWNNPAQIVAWLNLLKARGEGASQDEIAAGLKYRSLTFGAFRITCKDLHIEGNPLDFGGRTEFLKSNVKLKGSQWKAQTV